MEDDGRQNFENMCYCIDRETQRDVEIDSGKFCLRTDVFDISEEEAKEFDLRNLYLRHLKRNVKHRAPQFGYEYKYVLEDVYGYKPKNHLKLII